jgi:hypothetical protein
MDGRSDLASVSLSVPCVVLGRMVTRVKAQYDAYQAGRLAPPPVIDILVVSGGGDWGAFGAGFLVSCLLASVPWASVATEKTPPREEKPTFHRISW